MTTLESIALRRPDPRSAVAAHAAYQAAEARYMEASPARDAANNAAGKAEARMIGAIEADETFAASGPTDVQDMDPRAVDWEEVAKTQVRSSMAQSGSVVVDTAALGTL